LGRYEGNSVSDVLKTDRGYIVTFLLRRRKNKQGFPDEAEHLEFHQLFSRQIRRSLLWDALEDCAEIDIDIGNKVKEIKSFYEHRMLINSHKVTANPTSCDVSGTKNSFDDFKSACEGNSMVISPSIHHLDGCWQTSLGDFVSSTGQTVHYYDSQAGGSVIVNSSTILHTTTVSIGKWDAILVLPDLILWKTSHGDGGESYVSWKRLVSKPSLVSVFADLKKNTSPLGVDAATAIASNAYRPKGNINDILMEGERRSRLKHAQVESIKKRHLLDPPQQCEHCCHKFLFTTKPGLRYHRHHCPAAWHAMNSPKASRNKLFGASGLANVTFPTKFRKIWSDDDRAILSLISLWGLRHRQTFENKNSLGSDTADDAIGTNYCPSSTVAGMTRHVIEYLYGHGVGRLNDLSNALFRPEVLSIDEMDRNHLDKVKLDIRSGRFRQWSSLVRDPSLPFFQPLSRCGTGSYGATAAAYCVTSILPWDPMTYWPFINGTCPFCKSQKYRSNGWTDGKTLQQIEKNVKFIAKRHVCGACKRHFNADRPEFLNSLPEFARLVFKQYCGTFTHKKGVSAGLKTAITTFAASTESFDGIKKLMADIQGDDYAHNLNIMSSVDAYERANPTTAALACCGRQNIANRPLQMFSLGDFRGETVSTKYLRTVFKKSVNEVIPYMLREQAALGAVILCGDTTFKVPSRYVVGGGRFGARLTGLISVHNEHGQILDQGFLAGTS
jgi:hypothetical protein